MARNNKYQPPMSNAEFLETAEPLTVTVGGTPLEVEPKAFKTGSVGFHASGPINVMVDGKVVKVQANILLTVVGSKPETESAAA